MIRNTSILPTACIMNVKHNNSITTNIPKYNRNPWRDYKNQLDEIKITKKWYIIIEEILYFIDDLYVSIGFLYVIIIVFESIIW